MTTYGIVIFDQAEELDFVGPWEVFTASRMLHGSADAEADTVTMIAERSDPITSAKGMVVIPTTLSPIIPTSMLYWSRAGWVLALK